MTVHFFYNFKEELIQKVKKDYALDLAEKREEMRKQKQLDEVEDLILDYFKSVKNALNEVFEVSQGAVQYEENTEFIVKFSIGKNQLMFTRQESNIEVKVSLYLDDAEIVESKILGHIVPGEKSPTVKEVGKLHTGSHFDENTINHYMRIAFSSYLAD